MSQPNEDETSTLRERLGGTVRAVLSRSSDGSKTAQQDGQAEPQARDKRPILIGSREHTEEPDQDGIVDWIEAYKENPLIRVPVQNFSSDVLEPGASVSLDPRTPGDDDVEAPTVPQDYPDEEYRGLDLDDALERWLAECYVDGWDFDADATDLLEDVVKDRRGRRGTAIVEHAWDDPTERQRLLALRPIKTETVTAYTREGKNIVLRPDDGINDFESAAIQDLGNNSREKAPTTPAGKTAAIAQYDSVFGSDERDEIPFALDDISVSAYDADTGSLFGRPDTATVVDRAQAVYQKLEHVDQAIVNTAFSNIIAKVDTDDRELAKKIRDDLSVNSPETVSGTNVPTEIIELEGTVPDAVAQIQQEIEFVLAAMPTPLYRVGFAGDINRDITTEQREDYRDEVKRERRRLEADFQKALEQKAREFLYGDAHADEALDVVPRLQIRPADAESPLRDEEFDPEAFATLMNGLSTAAGPKGGADVIIPREEIVGTLLEMDADEVLGGGDALEEAGLEALDEADPRVREAFDEFTGASLAASQVRFSNFGGDPFGDQSTLESFLNELDEAADGPVRVGDTEWPAENYSIHDRPVTALDLEEDEAARIWDEYKDEAVALGGPQVDAGAELANRYSEGDTVTSPDGDGVVVAVWMSSWESDNDEVEASENSPAYTVALVDGGYDHYSGSDLEQTSLPEPEDVGDPVDDLEEAELAAALEDADLDDEGEEADLGVTDFDYPESWQESDTPNRVILLKAWAGMEGQFDCSGGCCKGEMLSSGMNERAANQFCAAMKDRVLGTEQWRGWGE